MHPDPGLRNGVRIFVFASILRTCALLSTPVYSTQNGFFFASCFRCIAYVSARFLQVFSLAFFVMYIPSVPTVSVLNFWKQS